MSPLSLAALTVLDLPPPEAVSVAHRTGYDRIGLRLMPAAPGGTAYPLFDDPAMMRETKARLADTGITVFDIEMIRLGAETHLPDYVKLFEAAAELGAGAVLIAGDDPDEARLTDSYAALCDMTAPYGLTMDLEFMPWTPCADLAAAMRVVGAANRPNAGVLVDSLHFDRSRSRFEDLAKLPRAWMHYAQLCDAPAGIPTTVAELIHTAREARMFPGEGGIDLSRIFRGLPRDLPVSLEIPIARERNMGPEERAARAIATARDFLARLDDREAA